MKPIFVINYTIMGACMGWPVEVFMGRNERTKLWSLRFRYSDSEHGATDRSSGLEPFDIVCMVDNNNCNRDDFYAALLRTKKPELLALVEDLKVAAEELGPPD